MSTTPVVLLFDFLCCACRRGRACWGHPTRQPRWEAQTPQDSCGAWAGPRPASTRAQSRLTVGRGKSANLSSSSGSFENKVTGFYHVEAGSPVALPCLPTLGQKTYRLLQMLCRLFYSRKQDQESTEEISDQKSERFICCSCDHLIRLKTWPVVSSLQNTKGKVHFSFWFPHCFFPLLGRGLWTYAVLEIICHFCFRIRLWVTKDK